MWCLFGVPHISLFVLYQLFAHHAFIFPNVHKLAHLSFRSIAPCPECLKPPLLGLRPQVEQLPIIKEMRLRRHVRHFAIGDIRIWVVHFSDIEFFPGRRIAGIEHGLITVEAADRLINANKLITKQSGPYA